MLYQKYGAEKGAFLLVGFRYLFVPSSIPAYVFTVCLQLCMTEQTFHGKVSVLFCQEHPSFTFYFIRVGNTHNTVSELVFHYTMTIFLECLLQSVCDVSVGFFVC